MSISLIETKKNYHVSINTVLEFEAECKREIECTLVSSPIEFMPFAVYIEKAVAYTGIPKVLRYGLQHLGNSNRHFFSIFMGTADIVKALPFFLLSGQKSIYLFDCWERTFDILLRMIDNYAINQVFFSAKQSALIMQKKAPHVQCIWIPEAISIQPYYAKHYSEKDIDVLQIGRKYDEYHDAIVQYCKDNSIVYLYEEKKGDVIFPDQRSFFDGLARSKVNICFPSSITHKERSGNISTMTQRYLQAMASKCLILGIMPYDMEELFDYCPIVEVDMNAPCEQLTDVLAAYHSYQPLIEKNYSTVMEHHQWKHRIREMKRYMQGTL